VIQAFVRKLDIDYDAGFKCPICYILGPENLVLILDGKAMGLLRSIFKEYQAPVVESNEKEPL